MIENRSIILIDSVNSKSCINMNKNIDAFSIKISTKITQSFNWIKFLWLNRVNDILSKINSQVHKFLPINTCFLFLSPFFILKYKLNKMIVILSVNNSIDQINSVIKQQSSCSDGFSLNFSRIETPSIIYSTFAKTDKL